MIDWAHRRSRIAAPLYQQWPFPASLSREWWFPSYGSGISPVTAQFPHSLQLRNQPRNTTIEDARWHHAGDIRHQLFLRLWNGSLHSRLHKPPIYPPSRLVRCASRFPQWGCVRNWLRDPRLPALVDHLWRESKSQNNIERNQEKAKVRSTQVPEGERFGGEGEWGLGTDRGARWKRRVQGSFWAAAAFV